MAINRVAVLGSGVMGAGIAAHLTNAGVEVVLLDIPVTDGDDRSRIARDAVSRLSRARPAAFMDPGNSRKIQIGNLEDDIDRLADVDWIIEAVVERLDIKQGLYERVDAVRKPGTYVSSNTSTIPLERLVDGRPDGFRQDFLITHFFNPPRYMRLLELVRGPDTRANAVGEIGDFCDRSLGKGVVECNDRPGFIANRIGVYWLQVAACEAIGTGLSVEVADAVVGPPMGIPKTGVFGLLDLVGLDLMPHVLSSLTDSLPDTDAIHEYGRIPDVVERLVADGYTGRKGKGGFYRLDTRDGARVKQALDFTSGEYRDAEKPRVDAVAAAKADGLRGLIEHDSEAGRYARRVLLKTLSYAASLVPEIAGAITAVDLGMKLGYNWRRGPFELLDELGSTWAAGAFEDAGIAVPDLVRQVGDGRFYRVGSEQAPQASPGALQYFAVDGAYRAVERPAGVERLEDIKRGRSPVAANESASLWDLGDGALGLEFHTKMNAIDPNVLAMAERALDTVPGGFDGLVIYNEADNFSVGANLGLILLAANTAAWDDIEAILERGQQCFAALRSAPFPVIGAPSGMALGGGCEVLLHCDAVVAHAETYMGLVEVGVGLVPGWGGCKELLHRWLTNERRPGGPMPPVAQSFETISLAKVSGSAAEARRLLFLGPNDRIVMNRDRVLAAAKARLSELARAYEPPAAPEFRLPGRTAKAALAMAVDGFHKRGLASDFDRVVALGLADVLSGGDTDITDTLDEQSLFDLERGTLMSLIRQPKTLARVEHTLQTGKPLRN